MAPNGRRPLNQVLLIPAIIGVFLLLTIIMSSVAGAAMKPTVVPLTQAVAEINLGRVAEANINDQTNVVTLKLNPTAGGALETSNYPYVYSGELTKLMLAKDVKVTTEPLKGRNIFVTLIGSLLPILLIMGFLIYITKSGALTGNIGKFSGKRGQQAEIPETRFSDVAGVDEAVEELREIVDILKDDSRFAELGAQTPKGALLVGPPGTGKTLLARAVAGEAGVPFFPVAGSDFVETFVGVGARRTRELFEKARAAGKAIIFIDEIDAVGRKRSGAGGHGGESERENTLISMLNEMDGFTASGVIILAATNRADVLDDALLRRGRFDRQIQVPNPDRRGRTEILKVHTLGKPIMPDVDLVTIARQTPGMSGADLSHLVNEACLEAVRRGLKMVDSTCFQAAVASVSMGRARVSALVTESDREVTAWHEAGHTVAALLQPDADDPISVSIVPRGQAGGVTWMGGNDNIFLTRKQACAQLTTAMAGRAAEEILLHGEHTQGASGDLAAATDLATRMVCEYGMTDFGYPQVEPDTLRMGGEVAAAARVQISTLLNEAHARAVDVLAEHEALLRSLVAELLAEETVGHARIVELAEKVGAWPLPSAAAPVPGPNLTNVADLS